MKDEDPQKIEEFSMKQTLSLSAKLIFEGVLWILGGTLFLYKSLHSHAWFESVVESLIQLLGGGAILWGVVYIVTGLYLFVSWTRPSK